MLSCDVRERRDATIYDVARAVGVSAATVSRILSGTGQFAPATRRAVEEAVRGLGYRPNPSARALAIRSTRTIGVRLPPLDNPFYAEVIRGVQAVAASEQFAIVLYTSQLGPTGDRTPLELFEVNQVDGAIVDGILITDPEARRLERSELPVVSLDWGAGRTRMPWCRWTIWRAHAWRSSTCWSSGMPDRAHLGSRGRRRPDGRSAGRLGGGLCGGGADSDPRLLAYGDFGEAGGHAAMHRLLESGAGPTAVFAFNDLTAVGALRALGQRGLRVPEDVSVVGFDDIRVARLRPRR